MIIQKKVVESVDVEVVRVHAKICDSGFYSLVDTSGKEVAVREDYVPSFFPGEHFGDYLILDIELDTGRIKNWKRPDSSLVAQAFGLLGKE